MKQLKEYTKTNAWSVNGMPLFLLLLLVLNVGCKKDKTNFEYDNRNITDVRKNSSVRIINLASYNQAKAGKDTLTNYVIKLINDPVSKVYPVTKYFPTTGTLGSTWAIPQELIKNGKAAIMVEAHGLNVVPFKLDLDIEEDAKQAFDYYLLPHKALGVTGQPDFVKVPRSVSAPANPSHFKVRLLNLSATVLTAEGMENLVGPMTLSWADGTAVNTETSNIQTGKYSEYIELPYGTSQLKVLSAGGIQVPGYASTVVLNPQTSTISGLTLSYIPLKTFAPGGIYTVVVAARNYVIPYANGNPGETVNGYQNSMRIINDISETANTTYGRMQAVNAIPGATGLKVKVNGKDLGSALSFTAHTEYEAFITGDYSIEASNTAGETLAKTTLKLDPNTNFTLWVHPDASGKATISAVANNLSGTFPREASDDASFARFKDEFPIGIRFLNLCPDLPYLTYTTNNAQSFSSVYGFNSMAVNNLRPGAIPTESPYISANYTANPYQFMAFRSTPAVVPGEWASDIPVLTGQDLIARPELYIRGELPNHEPGFYTVALVGSTKPGTPAAQRAKMIILKHTK